MAKPPLLKTQHDFVGVSLLHLYAYAVDVLVKSVTYSLDKGFKGYC